MQLFARMQRALEYPPGLAVLEAAFLILWVLLMQLAHRRQPGSEPFDDGPWWSVWFFRVWAACHIPVLLLQAGLHALFRKPQFTLAIPFIVGAFVIHAVNLLLVVLIQVWIE